MTTKTVAALLLLSATIVLTGCGDDEAAKASREAARKYQTWLPNDPVLADKYKFSCKACHTDPNNADAPQAGDKVAWSDSLDMARVDLMRRVIDGYEGMPPLGQCTECSADDLNALIDFMAEPEKHGRASE